MAAQPDLVGTVTLTSGQTGFTVAGINMVAADVQAGDQILLPAKGLVLTIGSRTNATTGTLSDPCPAGAAGAAQPCRIRFQSDLARVAAQARNLIDLIGSGNVEALSGLVLAANKGIHATGPNTLATHDLTVVARNLLAAVSGGAMYGVLGEIPNAQIPGRLSEEGTNLADLNLGVMSGWYRNASSAAANTPVAASGVMQVIRYSATYLKQFWWRLADGEQFERALINGVWSTWRRTAEFSVVGDGLVFRHANGFQLCAQKASMTVTSAGAVQTTGNVSFPAAFSVTPISVPAFERIVPTAYDVGVGHYPGSPSASAFRVSFWRSGGSSFPVDNVLVAHVISFGRWYN